MIIDELVADIILPYSQWIFGHQCPKTVMVTYLLMDFHLIFCPCTYLPTYCVLGVDGWENFSVIFLARHLLSVSRRFTTSS